MKIKGQFPKWILCFCLFCSLNNSAIIDILGKNRYTFSAALASPPKTKYFKIHFSAATAPKSETRASASKDEKQECGETVHAASPSVASNAVSRAAAGPVAAIRGGNFRQHQGRAPPRTLPFL